MEFTFNDGGRIAAGYKGHNGGDCVTRSIAIAADLPYQDVYDRLSHGQRTQRGKKSASARGGVNVKRKWFKDYMAELSFSWTPTMFIGSGCKVHLHDGELPTGRLVVSVSKHYTCLIDGVVHDNHDPQREIYHCEWDAGQDLKPGQWRNENGVFTLQRRCVYGFWMLQA